MKKLKNGWKNVILWLHNSMTVNSILNYYQSIIPDANQFVETCSTPLPTCIWTNTLKTSPQALYDSLKTDFNLTPLAWNSNAFRCDDEKSLGKTWQYLAGLYQIQEEVSMLPVRVLNPQPGEKILDLCAAPGNKTAQISVMMKNSGSVIANDRNYGRMRALGQIMKRLSLVNISTTIYDGTCYPKLNNYFDKVLVDAPCSCEGTLRKNLKKVVEPSQKHSEYLARIQTALLKKAIRLTKPGGDIVYSTCTFSPIENEAVVDAVLKDYGEHVYLEVIDVPGFNLSPGITQWYEQTYDLDVLKTRRIWPHLNDSGGFFIAHFKKYPKQVETYDNLQKTFLSMEAESIKPYIDMVCDRFGFDSDLFSHYRYSDANRRGIYLLAGDSKLPDSLKVDASGLFFIKTDSKFPKLTTSAAMLFGKYANKNYIHLTNQQVDAYLTKQEIELSAEQINHCTDTGFVIVNGHGSSLGLGLFLTAHENKGPRLQSLFPTYLQGP